MSQGSPNQEGSRSRIRMMRGEGAALLGCGLGVGVLALLFVISLGLLIDRQPEVEAFMLTQQRDLVLLALEDLQPIDRERLLQAFDRAEVALREGRSDPIRMQRLWTQLMDFSLGARDNSIDQESVQRLIEALDDVSGSSHPSRDVTERTNALHV